MNLPGAICDRFFALASKSRADERVFLENFTQIMLDTYGSGLLTKLWLVFNIFDF